MSRNQVFAFAGLIGLLAASPAAAQEQGQDGQALVLSVQGGGFSPLAHLDQPGNVDFKTGYNVGGGLAYQFNRHVALRGNFTFARAEGRDISGGLTSIGGTKFNRFLYDADVQFRAPLSGGATPYLFVGGGGVTIKPDVTPSQASFTKGAGKVGVGINYQIPRSNLGLYVEGTGWLYKWDRYGFDKTQFDTTWSGGLSYRFRL
jgi:opacity protein-like surface antigen